MPIVAPHPAVLFQRLLNDIMLTLTCSKKKGKIKNVASPSCCLRVFSPPEEVKILSSHRDIELHGFFTPSRGAAPPAAAGSPRFHIFTPGMRQKAPFDQAEAMLFDAAAHANDG